MGHEDMICHQTTSMERREESRSRHESLILLEEIRSGRYTLGEVTEYSIGGMGLRSEYGLEPGTDIFIGIENSPYSSNHDFFPLRSYGVKNGPTLPIISVSQWVSNITKNGYVHDLSVMLMHKWQFWFPLQALSCAIRNFFDHKIKKGHFTTWPFDTYIVDLNQFLEGYIPWRQII